MNDKSWFKMKTQEEKVKIIIDWFDSMEYEDFIGEEEALELLRRRLK